MSSWDDLAAEVDYDPSQRAGLLSPYVKRRNTLIPIAAREADKAHPRRALDGDNWNRVYLKAMDRMAREEGLVKGLVVRPVFR